jgi:hypothetical protein
VQPKGVAAGEFRHIKCQANFRFERPSKDQGNQ